MQSSSGTSGGKIYIRKKKIRILSSVSQETKIPQKEITKPTIFLADSNVQSKGYENGKKKSEEIFLFNSGRRKYMMERIDVKNKEITLDLFYECLDVYNNNQLVLKSMRMTPENIRDLMKLEKWFCSIPEPYAKGDSDWKNREKQRVHEGISSYCDDAIRNILIEEYRRK